MHRKTSVSRNMNWKSLIGLVVAGLVAAPATAQEVLPRPAPRPEVPGERVPELRVPVGGKRTVGHPSNQKLKKVTNENPTVATVENDPNDPATVKITALASGVTRITLVDVNNRQEVFDVRVPTNADALKKILNRVVPSANLKFDLLNEERNNLAISGTVGNVDDIQRVKEVVNAVGGFSPLFQLRVGGVSQVQLCVVVAQVSRSEFRRMAFNFLTQTTHFFLGSTVGQAVAEPALVGPNLLGTGAPGSPNGSPTNLFFGFFNNRDSFLGFLQALKDENVVKLLAEPKLVTISGRQADFLSGGEQAVPIPATLGQVGVNFYEFGTRLSFLPVVLGNGKIHLEVSPEVSNLDPANGTSIQGTVVPGRDTQKVHTVVELEDGQTLAIGGLIQRTSEGFMTKIPVLGELPFVGPFFSSKSLHEQETELVILVTPRLVDGMACNQLPKYVPGQETRSPDDFELFLEQILEAPRGQRDVFQDRHYVAPYKNSPTAATFPCGDNCAGRKCGNRLGGACGSGGCATGACGSAPAAPEHKPVVQTAVIKAEDVPVEISGQEHVAPQATEPSPGVVPASAENSTPAPPVGPGAEEVPGKQ
jgi:pilus assembly protein CpaC